MDLKAAGERRQLVPAAAQRRLGRHLLWYNLPCRPLQPPDAGPTCALQDQLAEETERHEAWEARASEERDWLVEQLGVRQGGDWEVVGRR